MFLKTSSLSPFFFLYRYVHFCVVLMMIHEHINMENFKRNTFHCTDLLFFIQLRPARSNQCFLACGIWSITEGFLGVRWRCWLTKAGDRSLTGCLQLQGRGEATACLIPSHTWVHPGSGITT